VHLVHRTLRPAKPPQALNIVRSQSATRHDCDAPGGVFEQPGDHVDSVAHPTRPAGRKHSSEAQIDDRFERLIEVEYEVERTMKRAGAPFGGGYEATAGVCVDSGLRGQGAKDETVGARRPQHFNVPNHDVNLILNVYEVAATMTDHREHGEAQAIDPGSRSLLRPLDRIDGSLNPNPFHGPSYENHDRGTTETGTAIAPLKHV